jgi:hypothetical protein
MVNEMACVACGLKLQDPFSGKSTKKSAASGAFL